MVMLIAAFVVAATALGPILLIWALNTLFGLGIPLTWGTWFAALIVGGVTTLKMRG